MQNLLQRMNNSQVILAGADLTDIFEYTYLLVIGS